MADSRESGRQLLALELVRQAVHGTLISLGELTPLLQKLLPRQDAGAEGYTLYDILCLLQGHEEAAARALAERLHAVILHEAARAGLSLSLIHI